MNRLLLTDEERLQALYEKLKEAGHSEPIGFHGEETARPVIL